MSTDCIQNHKLTVYGVEEWQKKWLNGEIGCHQDKVHPLLERHIHTFLDMRENMVIFVPLCGKTLDIKWLSDKGHTVVGVECADLAVEKFFKEQEVEYTKEPMEQVKGSLYKSKDGKMKLYCCDLYDLSKDFVGQFDAIWDHGSMVSINPSERRKYADLLMSLMKPKCRLFLDTYDYDETQHIGRPFNIPEDQIKELYGDTCSVEEIDAVEGSKERNRKWGFSSLTERIHLIVKT